MDHHPDDSSAGRALHDHEAPLRSGGVRAVAPGLDAGTVGGHVVLVPISGIQRAVVKALRYASSLGADVRGVYVALDPASTERAARRSGNAGARA